MSDTRTLAATLGIIRRFGNNTARLRPAGGSRFRWHAGSVPLNNLAVFALIERGWARLFRFDTATIVTIPGAAAGASPQGGDRG